MADKKPAGGARDIGDLKARLGLKPAKAAAAQAQTPAGYPAQTGVPAPVPPPPGFGPPPGPAQPPPPDLTRDPFAVAAAPAVAPKVDFVVPKEWDAAGPGDAAQKKSAAPKYLLFLGIALVPLIVGYACGRINGARQIVALTIGDAKKIKTEVDSIAATNQKVENAFDESMARQVESAKAGKAAAIPDMKLVEDLKGLNLVVPVPDKLFRTNYFQMKDLAIERLFAFYYNTIILYERANAHIKRTESDKDLLERYQKQAAAAKEVAEQTFGIIIDPSGPIPLGKLVMTGEIICKKDAPKEGCPKPTDWDGVQVKSDQSMAFSKRFLRTPKDTERVILIDKTSLFQKVIVGSPEALAAEAYGRRLKEIKEVVEKLKPARKDVVKELDDQAGKPKPFHL
ncbi:MAG: hypothetical protein HY906_01710 [Deltaproteobacteria bacterium]|nr:hypothetical protein [Deltaproteobacteria bacterium]